ncbi:MAG: CYTH domain-containing protein [Rhodospirillales bacterium]|nr:CYTH domain-containing protein [Rhodospirillales bacterium]
MAFEIERKFLVIGQDWQKLAIARTRIRQAYLAAEGALSIRVRIKDGHAATLTIKSRGAELRRLELEYPIPATDAEALMARRQGSVIEKVRHDIPWNGLLWEVDVFTGDNEGLVLAEIELDHERQPFDLPPWVGTEVTMLRKFYNGDLARRPFRDWSSSVIENVA